MPGEGGKGADWKEIGRTIRGGSTLGPSRSLPHCEQGEPAGQERGGEEGEEEGGGQGEVQGPHLRESSQSGLLKTSS